VISVLTRDAVSTMLACLDADAGDIASGHQASLVCVSEHVRQMS